MRLPRQVLRSEVVPPEAGELAVPPREAGSDGRMVGYAGCRYDTPAPWPGSITSSVVSGSVANVSISSRWLRRRRSISLVEQLPSASQMTFGGALYREDRPLKSPSLDTMVKPCCLAYAQTAESSAAARPTART